MSHQDVTAGCYSTTAAPADSAWRVLVVDHEPECAEILKHWLEHKGAEVAVHSGAMAALAEFRQRPHYWDALVTNHAMPGMSGMDLVRRAQSIRPTLACVICADDKGDVLDYGLLPPGNASVLEKRSGVGPILECLKRQVFSTPRVGRPAPRRHARVQPACAGSLSCFVDSLPAAVLATDRDGTCCHVNSLALTLTGQPRDGHVGKHWLHSIYPADHARASDAWQRAVTEDRGFAGEVRLQAATGATPWMNLHVGVRKDRHGAADGHLLVLTPANADQDDRKRSEAWANYDVLTGLPNRTLVRDRLRQAISFAKRTPVRVALLLVDIDHFKLINDTLGHSVGDAMLAVVAQRLERCVRECDTVSRMGDDEFLVVLSDVHAASSAATVAAKIRQALVEPIGIDGKEINATVSVGVSVYPDDGDDFDTLLGKADTALHLAKAVGRNACRFYAEDMNQSSLRQFAMIGELHRALDHGEFRLTYQPVVAIDTGKVVGAEALLRWHHPVRGLVAPSEFIPAAESCGLIVPIGEWVLGEACRQAAAWNGPGRPPVFVAVNVSPVQFRRGGLDISVARALAESGLPASLLELEITESTLIDDDVATRRTVEMINATGVSFSIDDFGTGYAGFSYLKRFDLRKLKIDRSFIADILHDKSSSAIVSAIVQMAQGLGLAVVAEGIEDEATLDVVRAYGGQYAQGYHFSRPLPPDQFVETLALMNGDGVAAA